MYRMRNTPSRAPQRLIKPVSATWYTWKDLEQLLKLVSSTHQRNKWSNFSRILQIPIYIPCFPSSTVSPAPLYCTHHSNSLVILKKPHLCWSTRFHTICILHHLKCFYYVEANWAPSRGAWGQISVRRDWERAFLSFPRFSNLSFASSSSSSSFFNDCTTTKINVSLNMPVVHVWTETGEM